MFLISDKIFWFVPNFFLFWFQNRNMGALRSVLGRSTVLLDPKTDRFLFVNPRSIRNHTRNQASPGRRRPRRPGFPNSLFPS